MKKLYPLLSIIVLWSLFCILYGISHVRSNSLSLQNRLHLLAGSSRAVVQIFWEDELWTRAPIGTGAFVRTDGIILTSKHIFEKKYEHYFIRYNDQLFPIKKIHPHSSYDIAILETEHISSAPILSLNDNNEHLRIGDMVVGFWYSSSLTVQMSFGIISSVTATLPEHNLHNLILSDIVLYSGNSGGPLLDIEWRIIAVHTAVTTYQKWWGWSTPVTSWMVREVFPRF